MSDMDSDETSVVIVSLNISQTNITTNGSQARIFVKTPNDDRSLDNIFVVIGAVFVILFLLLIIITLIRKCYKIYQEDDEKPKDPVQNPPLPTPVNMRRNSSVRNSYAPVHRSSLDVTIRMEFNQRRFSQPYESLPPTNKKP